MQILVASEGRPRPLEDFVAGNLILQAQEGITNAIKHAEAKQIGLKLEYGESSCLNRRSVRQSDVIGNGRRRRALVRPRRRRSVALRNETHASEGCAPSQPRANPSAPQTGKAAATASSPPTHGFFDTLLAGEIQLRVESHPSGRPQANGGPKRTGVSRSMIAGTLTTFDPSEYHKLGIPRSGARRSKSLEEAPWPDDCVVHAIREHVFRYSDQRSADPVRPQLLRDFGAEADRKPDFQRED